MLVLHCVPYLSWVKMTEAADDSLFVQFVCFTLHPSDDVHLAVEPQSIVTSDSEDGVWTAVQQV